MGVLRGSSLQDARRVTRSILPVPEMIPESLTSNSQSCDCPTMKSEPTWLDHIVAENRRFQNRICQEALPVKRTPGSFGVITCMDPRVNLEAIGIPRFGPSGECDSPIRIIRTIGAMAEPRSLLIGTFLAGIREFAVVMHTDCGCCLALTKIDLIIDNLQKRLSPTQLSKFRDEIGEPFRTNLINWLKAFDDPHKAIKDEIANILSLSFIPRDLVLHGLLYDLESGKVEVVVNGYET